MLNVSTALPTPSPRGAPAIGRVAGDDFKDTLDGLIAAPAAGTLLVLPTAKVDLPALPMASGTPDTSATPAVAPSMEPLIATLVDPTLAVPPAIPQDTAKPDPATSLLPPLPTRRQALADGGKTLPDELPDEDPSKDVIWLPTALVPPVPVPVARPIALPTLGATIAPAATPVAGSTLSDPTPTTPAQAGAQSREPIAQLPPSPGQAPAATGVAVEGNAPAAPAKNGVPAAQTPELAKPEQPIRPDAGTAIAAPAQPVAPLPAPILPASQAFAAAIAAAVQQGRDEREPAEPHASLAIATAAVERLHTPAVTAPADARQTALDLRQDSGLQGMIDHIEVLRDGANAGDTRIRLVPDALGAVDVSVRRDGDRLHVHFNAENQASARLISEAQPRLAELADARGVKLGQTSVDSGDGQSRRQQPATPTQFIRPVAASDSIDTPDDLRVA